MKNSVSQKKSETPEFAYPAAPVFMRVFNHIADIILSVVFAFIFCIILLLVIEKYFTDLSSLGFYLWSLSLYYLAIFLYYFLSERFLGRSPAKYFTKTQVIDIDKGLSTTRIIGRTLARCIPFEGFAVLGSEGRTVHDSISKTWVVRSADLPKNMRPSKKQDIVLTVFFAILLALTVGSMTVYKTYEDLTGGERIDLPKAMPTGLKLTEFREVSSNDRDFFTFRYDGESRGLRINRLISGFEYDSKQDCTLMLPSSNSEQLISSAFNESPYESCTEIYKNSSKPYVHVFKQTASRSRLEVDSRKIADYYITDPPYRLVIKIDRGKFSDEEIINMAKSGLQEYKEDQLKGIHK